jgi:DNA-3-methyladenine glycosylase
MTGRPSSAPLPIGTRALAKALIGYVLATEVNGVVTSGRIVETEAYLLGDPACHAYSGKSERNATLFGPPHRAYVYLIYGTYFCFNLSSEEDGAGAGVLVRALEPIEGIAAMERRRKTSAVRDLCRGPGRLCQALGIDRRMDGAELFTGRRIWLAPPDRPRGRIRASRRIGITAAANRPLRYYEAGNRFVSGPAWLSPP